MISVVGSLFALDNGKMNYTRSSSDHKTLLTIVVQLLLVAVMQPHHRAIRERDYICELSLRPNYNHSELHLFLTLTKNN